MKDASLYKAAKGYDTILVDFFDTIVHRRVHPREVICLWAEQVRPRAGILCDAAQLYKIRMQALKKFNKTLLNYSNADWMRELFIRLRSGFLIRENITFERFLQTAVDVEENLEIKSQFPNKKVLDVLRQLKADGKTIHVVSDFYLPEESLSRFLQAIGARDIFDSINVSCNFGKTKADGSLYPAVLEKIGVPAKQAFMIGDNHESDCVKSAQHGIASFRLRHRYNNNLYKAATRLLELDTTEHGFHAAWTHYERICRKSEFPFSEYVLVFYFFTTRLFAQLRQRQIQDVVFLSREGWMLKKFFDTYQQRLIPAAEHIRTHYLKMSRQSSVIVRLKPLSEETFSHFTDISIHDFLVGCGFSPAQMEELAQAIPENFPQTGHGAGDASSRIVISEFKESKHFSQLVENHKFQELYEQNRVMNKTAFGQMFAASEIPEKAQIGVVDVGWTGRMQDAIHELTGHPTAGFYIGLKTPSSLGEGVFKNGLIFSTIPCYSRYFHLLGVNTQIYEQLLMAPHGSAVSYSIDASEGWSVIENYHDAEKTLWRETVHPVQEFMEKIFRDLCDDVRLRAHEWDGDDWLAAALAKLTLKSGLFVNAERRRFVKKLSDGFVDNFASMGIGKKYEAKKILRLRTLLGFVLKPRTALKYVVKICTIENPFLRSLLFLFVALPYYLFMRFLIGGDFLFSNLYHRSCKKHF